MGRVRRVRKSRGLTPERYAASVVAIDPDDLVAAGYKAVLLDLDNTLLPRGVQSVSDEVTGWVQSLSRAGLGVCLVSNTAKPRVHEVAVALGVPVVESAHKPFVAGYVRACELLGVRACDAVMVGDQTYTDIWGAHRAGMDAILVQPLSTVDLFHTRLLRKLDAFVVRNMQPEPVPCVNGRK